MYASVPRARESERRQRRERERKRTATEIATDRQRERVHALKTDKETHMDIGTEPERAREMNGPTEIPERQRECGQECTDRHERRHFHTPI